MITMRPQQSGCSRLYGLPKAPFLLFPCINVQEVVLGVRNFILYRAFLPLLLSIHYSPVLTHPLSPFVTVFNGNFCFIFPKVSCHDFPVLTLPFCLCSVDRLWDMRFRPDGRIGLLFRLCLLFYLIFLIFPLG